jgi:hypothetical protein
MLEISLITSKKCKLKNKKKGSLFLKERALELLPLFFFS